MLANTAARKDNSKYQSLQDNLKNALIGNAGGVFRWVQIWLDILLPVGHDQRTIRSDKVAKKRLEQLKYDVRHNNEAYQRLEAGYQRLWDLNALEDAEELGLRTRLFHFVLCAFERQTTASISEALRVQGSSHEDYPTPEDVRRLFANFLEEAYSPDGQLELRFVHESARKFILNIKTSDQNNSGESNGQLFSDNNNHASVLRLYIELVGTSTHAYWRSAGFDPSKWKTFTSATPDANRLHEDLQRWKDQTQTMGSLPLHIYLSIYGLRHCAHVAKKRSMFDATWGEVLDQVIMNPDSAFAFNMLGDLRFYMPYKDNHRNIRYPEYWSCSWHIWSQKDGQLQLLPTHVLACLDIICENDADRLQLDRPGVENFELHLYLKDAASFGGDISCPTGYAIPFRPGKATSLQLACVRKNKAAVRIILQAIRIQSFQAVREQLLFASNMLAAPFGLAILNKSYHIAKLLLTFEKEQQEKTSNTAVAQQFVSKQWSLPFHTFSALHFSVKYLDTVDILRLLEIAVPEDINLRDSERRTVLQIAAREGSLELIKALVEDYGAQIDVVDCKGSTPALLATSWTRIEVVEYFKTKGIVVNSDEDVPKSYR
jgi:hypothetical protein